MSALTFTLALPGLESLSIGLSRLQTDISDWSRFWKERFAPLLYGSVKQDFVLEGGHSGASWAPLSPVYAAWKASRFPGKGILVRSGALKASLSGPTAPLSVFRPGASSLEIGTAVPYAIYHQMGATWLRPNPKRSVGTHATLPQRPPMRVNDVFMRQVGKELQKHVHAAWVERRSAFRADVAASLNAGLP